MPVPRVPLTESLRYYTPSETIYCPRCKRWFKAGTREVVERLYADHLADSPDPDRCSMEPF